MTYNENVDMILGKALRESAYTQRIVAKIQHKRYEHKVFNEEEIEYMLKLGFTPYEVIKPKEEPLKEEIVSEIDDAIASIFGLTKEQMENEMKKMPGINVTIGDFNKTWGLK